ncbi:MAG TPA: hypothetical protein VMD59_11120 [Acidimicrobiales bacterium]|nr:hypothetical protein [Acidimicrobiales bacterium]
MKPYELTRWASRRGIKLFGERDLAALAGVERLEQARLLVDAIEDLYEDEWSLCGTVPDGDQAHLAMVHHADGPLSSECDCPGGRPGGWCEHSVAVALCYLADW